MVKAYRSCLFLAAMIMMGGCSDSDSKSSEPENTGDCKRRCRKYDDIHDAGQFLQFCHMDSLSAHPVHRPASQWGSCRLQ